VIAEGDPGLWKSKYAALERVYQKCVDAVKDNLGSVASRMSSAVLDSDFISDDVNTSCSDIIFTMGLQDKLGRMATGAAQSMKANLDTAGALRDYARSGEGSFYHAANRGIIRYEEYEEKLGKDFRRAKRDYDEVEDMRIMVLKVSNQMEMMRKNIYSVNDRLQFLDQRLRRMEGLCNVFADKAEGVGIDWSIVEEERLRKISESHAKRHGEPVNLTDSDED
jgi:hypothetical protein